MIVSRKIRNTFNTIVHNHRRMPQTVRRLYRLWQDRPQHTGLVGIVWPAAGPPAKMWRNTDERQHVGQTATLNKLIIIIIAQSARVVALLQHYDDRPTSAALALLFRKELRNRINTQSDRWQDVPTAVQTAVQAIPWESYKSAASVSTPPPPPAS